MYFIERLIIKFYAYLLYVIYVIVMKIWYYITLIAERICLVIIRIPERRKLNKIRKKEQSEEKIDK
jgi:hypothetical protein